MRVDDYKLLFKINYSQGISYMLLNKKISENSIKEFDRILKEVRDKHERILLEFFNKKFGDFKKSVDVSLEKLTYLCKLRFEKELVKIYDPDETDQVMIARQNELIEVMLYATEIYLSVVAKNRKLYN
jgi:hypothetical protein